MFDIGGIPGNQIVHGNDLMAFGQKSIT